jgi:hypothetical protein
MRCLLVLSAIVGLCVQADYAQAQDRPVTVSTLHGHCTVLKTPAGDLSSKCADHLDVTEYRDGNLRFTATTANNHFVSFYGTNIDKGNTGEVEISLVDFSNAKAKAGVETGLAHGTCTYKDPDVDITDVHCLASTVKGAFELQYVSDGKRPSVMHL